MKFMHRRRRLLSFVSLLVFVFGMGASSASAYYNPKTGKFISVDPNGQAIVLSPQLVFNGHNPTVTVSMAYELQYADGMNFYEYLRSNPNLGTDPTGMFNLIEFVETSAITLHLVAMNFVAMHPLAMQFAGGLMAGINLYAFAKYEEVQAIVLAQPNPGGIIAGDLAAVRLAMGEVLSTAGSITGLARASESSQQLATRAGQTVRGLAASGSKGGLYTIPGGQYTASEKKAAEYVASLGRDVVLRPPTGTRTGGGTSDLLVNGQNYDIYTPRTGNPDQIITRIADKKHQAIGVVVDLSETTVKVHELGDVMARLRGKGVTTIQEVIFLPK